MESTIFANLKKLYDYELYGDVITLVNILQTAFENDRSLFTIEQEYQVLMFNANAHYMERRYTPAVTLFRESLQFKKSLAKSKNPHIPVLEQQYEHFNEAETKYRFAICLRETQQSKKAIIVLQSIKNRTPKINYLLAKIQHSISPETSSLSAYRDVLIECPLAMDCIDSLLEIGVDGIEVNSLIVNTCNLPQFSDWLPSWIKAHDLMYGRKHAEAAETFRQINQNSKIRNNEKLMTLIGKAYYYNGNTEQALQYLDKVYSINPNMTNGIMELAVLFSKTNKMQELEKLTTPNLQISEYRSEHWFCLAQHLHAEDKNDKAAFFVQKALRENPRNIEAYILKWKILFRLRKHNAALMCLKTGQSMANYRFEFYKGLVQVFVGLGRVRHAQTLAAHALRYFKTSPRSYVLLARSLMSQKDAALNKKAKALIEKALELDEYYPHAVHTMIEILQSEGEINEAIKLLKKQVTVRPNCKMFSLLGDLLSTQKDMDGALDNYTMALNMDPNNSQALVGLNAIGYPTRGAAKPNETSYVGSSSLDEPAEDHSFEMVEISAAGDPESESETLWSDIVEFQNHFM